MEIFRLLHVIGFMLGFGGAALSGAIMINVRTDDRRLKRGRMARKICIGTWTGLILLIISGIGLDAGAGQAYGLLLTIKHLCVVIILADALLIHFWLFPRYFRKIGTDAFDYTYKTMRRIGMLSISCWVLIIILSAFLGR